MGSKKCRESQGHLLLAMLPKKKHEILHKYFFDRKKGEIILSDSSVAVQVGVSRRSVARWRHQYNRGSLKWKNEMLSNTNDKSGPPKALSDSMESDLLEWIKMRCYNHCPPSRDAVVSKAISLLQDGESAKTSLSLSLTTGFEKR